MDPESVRAGWAERTGRFSPTYYAGLGPDTVSETIREVLGHYVDTDARILELGCGSGRHLAALAEAGYTDLHGVDINDEASTVMAETYPKLAEDVDFTTAALEDHLPTLPDAAFDVVISVETLQHIHPDETDLFDEVARVTGELLVTAENEGNGPRRGRGEATTSYVDGEFPLYHRDWKRVFTDLGLAQLLVESTPRDTIRVFRSP